MNRIARTSALLALLVATNTVNTHAFQIGSRTAAAATAATTVTRSSSSTTLFATNNGSKSAPFSSKSEKQKEGRRQDSVLYSSVIAPTLKQDDDAAPAENADGALAGTVQKVELMELFPADVQSVLTTALLVTGNTVGAGALVLPELAAKPGFAISTAMFTGAYLINLLSGLILAEVAIQQHEAGGLEAPSSFRDFAEMSLESPQVANGISVVSLFVNTCALTFSLGRAGVILSDMCGSSAATAGVDHTVCSVAFAVLLAIMATTQSRVRISQISSGFVSALFLSVAALILPGLGHVSDPLATIMASGTSSDTLTGVLEVAPIMLTTLIFQNIVPPVTKILNYDRTKSVAALVLGSFLPLVLYLTWSFVVLGGGVDMGGDNLLMTVFSVAAVTGSSIGCTMAVAEELQSFLLGGGDDDSTIMTEDDDAASSEAVVVMEDDNGYALPAVLLAVTVPLVCSALCHEYTDALKVSGAYGIPVLYGAIPVVMAWTQRNKLGEDRDDLIPGGILSLGLVGAAFGAFMGNSVVDDVAHVLTTL
eukprot:CAMPEP_0119006346 /NCGR_PEP_ID=MMETSP1176-20130426/2246_1 /TAXON_ID=265551 /ORGANISM="Synedropsis recta cf, Strain CCMP1620" /LENGTH=536 /DNA_ID=CAMNT_0006958255 /DNA_START=109 /DNA_END=1719 /DNA_ORIENTATION=+